MKPNYLLISAFTHHVPALGEFPEERLIELCHRDQTSGWCATAEEAWMRIQALAAGDDAESELPRCQVSRDELETALAFAAGFHYGESRFDETTARLVNEAYAVGPNTVEWIQVSRHFRRFSGNGTRSWK
jgi:hypothetical protein